MDEAESPLTELRMRMIAKCEKKAQNFDYFKLGQSGFTACNTVIDVDEQSLMSKADAKGQQWSRNAF
jgi:hypothetical protein